MRGPAIHAFAAFLWFCYTVTGLVTPCAVTTLFWVRAGASYVAVLLTVKTLSYTSRAIV
jgi:hypothetical protein